MSEKHWSFSLTALDIILFVYVANSISAASASLAHHIHYSSWPGEFTGSGVMKELKADEDNLY